MLQLDIKDNKEVAVNKGGIPLNKTVLKKYNNAEEIFYNLKLDSGMLLDNKILN